MLTGGRESDIGQAENLIDGYSFDSLIGDQGYDSDDFVESVGQRGSEATRSKVGSMMSGYTENVIS